MYRGKDCIKFFCKLLTKEQQESYKNSKICYICKEKIENKCLKDKKIINLEIIVIIQENIDVLHHIAYVISNTLYLKIFL